MSFEAVAKALLFVCGGFAIYLGKGLWLFFMKDDDDEDPTKH